jgi:hypothetical protein
MTIPAEYRKIILRTAQHEAGHYVASRVLGFGVGKLSLRFTDYQGGHSGGSEITLARPLRTLEDTTNYLEDRVIVLYAGAVAEALQDDDIDGAIVSSSLQTGGGARDFKKIEELVNLIRNIKFPDR